MKKGVNDVTNLYLFESVWKLNLFRKALLTCPRANLITFIAVLFKFYEVFFLLRLEGFFAFAAVVGASSSLVGGDNIQTHQKGGKLARKVS